MNRYIRFDADRFIRDSRLWGEELSRLKEELDSITEIGGSGGQIPTSNEISRPVERTAIEREDILSRMQQIDEYQKAFKYAWEHVGEYDREMLEGFFFKPIVKFIEEWCVEHTSNRQYCYRDRRIALEHFREVIEYWIREHGYDV